MDNETTQALINSGMAWKLEGSVGRHCMRAIEAGKCLLGTEDFLDYWGNHVPSRYQVKEDTKGSFDFVVTHSGMDHAQAMADIGNEIPAF